MGYPVGPSFTLTRGGRPVQSKFPTMVLRSASPLSTVRDPSRLFVGILKVPFLFPGRVSLLVSLVRLQFWIYSLSDVGGTRLDVSQAIPLLRDESR